MFSGWCNLIEVVIILASVTDVIQGVRFITEPSDKVAAFNQSLLWNCEATDDNSDVTYSWTFNTSTLPMHENQVIYSNGSLLLRKVSYDDVGLYVCLASAGGTTVSSRAANLNIAYISPTFSIQPISQTAFLGDNVVLSCYIESLPPADIQWTLDGENVTRGEISHNISGASTLSLYPVMYYHVGTYKCVGSNPLTGVYRYSNNGKLYVKGQPVFLSSLAAVSVPFGFEAKFICYFHGNPEPKVTWFMHRARNDDIISKEIQSSEKYSVFSNGTLIIKDVNETDEAYYTCTAGNVFGEMSDSALLTVTGPAVSPEFTLRPSNSTVQEGYSVTFLCTCSGNPEPTHIWKKGAVEVSENSSLSINDAQSEDIGWYTCFCENAVGMESQSVYLDVYTHPKITQPPEDEVCKLGEPVFLHCSASGNPTPSVTWLTPRFGSVIISMTGVALYSNGSLHISSATIEDTGDYTCLARNIVGMVEASTSVTVHVAAELTLLPISQKVKVGSKVFLHCQANGVPAPTYSWSKDGEGMITSTSVRQIYLNNTLVIHAVTKQDDGVYRCIAGNDLGVTQAVATITVTVPPSFTTVPSNKTVQVGGSVQLRCVADGDPVPTQRWTKNDRQLSLDDNLEVSLDQSTVTITEIKPSHFGMYTCTATNLAGTESVSAWLNIYDIPEFSVVPSDTVVRQSATLSLLCQGQAIETPSVTWYRGRKGGVLTQLTNDIRATVTDSGLLQIKSVDESTDEGWYTCVVRNSAGAISEEVFVNVQVPPKILSTNSPQSATIQSQVTLTCQSIGDPAPSLQWIRPSGNAVNPSSTYKMLDNILMITSLSEEDVGSWTCKYCNSLGCDSALIDINVEGMPKIMSFTGVQDGSLVTLECTVEGNPEPAVTFSSKGQTLTSTFPGHTVRRNRMLIEKEFIKTEYKCVAGNIHGMIFRIIHVPSKMEVPIISQTNARTVTLSWKVPIDHGNLPLTRYYVQKMSDIDVAWQPVQVEGQDLLGQTSLEVRGLGANREYTFRIAATNILGLGEYSDQSPSVILKSTAPSVPENVLALEISPGVIVVIWKKSQFLNAPIADVVYEYKIFREKTSDGSVTELIHRRGTVLFNETLQVRIDDLNVATIYKLSLWARNIKLNVTSDTVTVTLDNTQATYLDPRAQSGISTFGRDKIIAIVAGSVGGVILVIIIVCIVTRVRAQKKTKTLSLLNHTLSLDQFYMENPKTLYTDDKFSSKRKSGISFYSFDESFQSTMGSKGKRAESVEYLGSDLNNDVLLVSKSPLKEAQRPISQASSQDQLYNENTEDTECVQSEIQLPDCDISLIKDESRLDEGQGQSGSDSNSLYSAMNGTNSDASSDYSTENICKNLYSEDLLASTPKQPLTRADNPGSQKRPLIVFSPDKTEDQTKSDTNEVLINKHKYKFCNKSGNSNFDKRGRVTRSASPDIKSKGNDSNQPKPPLKVLSLDLLKPSVKKESENGNNLKILAENMLKRNKTENKNIGDKSALNRKDIIKSRIPDDHLLNKETSGNCQNGQLCNNHENGDVCEKCEDSSAHIELNPVCKILNGTSGDNTHVDTVKGGNQCRDKDNLKGENIIMKQKPKNVLDDNFLTDYEIRQEISSAELY